MLEKLVRTEPDRTIAFLRVVLGIVFFAHGAQKMLGWFGGPGFGPAMTGFTEQLSIPAPLAFLAIATEFFGSLALIVGLLARPVALAVVVEMIVAVALVHLPYGFFMNWMGNQAGEGFEYHVLLVAIALAIVIKGAGAWSLDHLLAQQLGSPAAAGSASRWRRVQVH